MAEISRLSLGDDAEPSALRAPDMNSQGVVAVDITAKFSEASKGTCYLLSVTPRDFIGVACLTPSFMETRKMLTLMCD